ncbi:hypothetical protein LZZ90_06710 [Flavobacterium sp. SM15]|uniref:hypothetical protein n=1 Tax=Flavobacterium sp. SM15 TaxID=2908005 RepID=UPI001EDBD6BD|nr:hypothetical protein [Flavobacterium sp. SM15]MCG2611193.1 hypothetical protein [Flavobacterium sp. SM15]
MRKLLLLLFYCSLNAQVGIGTSSPDNDAMLEVLSSDKGILLPRVKLEDLSLSTPLTAHVSGMIVYNTAYNGTNLNTVFPGLYYNDGQRWVRLNPNTVKIGELKNSFAIADHNGWYLLNGRTISSLPATVQPRASALGFASNLPDGSNLFLRGKSASETLGLQGGNNSITLSQANLPNINFTGTTNTSGIHNHNMDSFIGMENIGLLSTTALTLFVTQAVAKETNIAPTKTSNPSGSHTHTVSFNSGGTAIPIDITPNYVATNIFIYLGN